MDDQLSLLVVGAHPDDCSIKAGGIAAKYVDAGHHVTFLSVTDGRAGHHTMEPEELATRRYGETQQVADTLGVDYTVFDIPDGELTTAIEYRERLIRFIRERDPDLILGPRPNDYHPDHRATGTLLIDAAYLLIVPHVCPDTPALTDVPVFGYVQDGFAKPAPFEPNVVLDVSDVEGKKLAALDCHESQVYEWLPYTWGCLDAVPDSTDARREWLATEGLSYFNANGSTNVANRFRGALEERYGSVATQITHAEAVEFSEFGAEPDETVIDRLFFW